MTTPEQHDQDEQTAAILAEAIDRFFEEVDADDFESEDLAWALIRAMKRAQAPTL
ncbi:hypothetical protein ACF1CG_36875 [Streptomyces sp. NPDC014773]|uniref:hypothetical protein n=1 Tax=Streptomyces sp. NPDC014773 TaxID=3364908 RepID=UPI0036F5C211